MLMQGLDAKRLSRRALLKGLGMAVGLVTLGGLSGCTQFLSRSKTGVPLAPVGSRGKASGVTILASRKINKTLAQNAKRKWQAVFATFKEDSNGKVIVQRDKFEEAVVAFKALVADYSRSGLAQEVDLKIAQMDLDLSVPHYVSLISTQLQEIGVPKKYITAMQDAWLHGNREKARQHILKHGGTSWYWQDIAQKLAELSRSSAAMSQLSSKALSLSEHDNLVLAASCGIGGAIGCAVAFTAAAIICDRDESSCDTITAIAAFACSFALAVNGCLQ